MEEIGAKPVIVCRLCLARGPDMKMTDIFDFFCERDVEIADIIMKCAPVQISRYDGLSNTICELCYAELIRVNRFQTRVVDSERMARQFQQKNEVRRNPNENIENSVARITIESNNNINPTPRRKPPEVSENLRINDNIQSVNNDQQPKCLKRSILDENDQNVIKPKIFKGNNVQSNESPKKCENFNKQNEINAIQESESTRTEILTQKNQNVDVADDNLSTTNIKTEPSDELDEVSTIPNSVETDQSNVPIKSEIVTDVKIESSTPNCNEDTDFIGEEGLMDVDISNPVSGQADLEILAELDNTPSREMLNKKLHKCDVCDKRFIVLDNLKVHKLNHTDGKLYVCDFCNEEFADSVTLIQHEKLHSRKETYKCKVCSKRFLEVSIFNNHKRIHTGEGWPSVCDICNVSCNSLFSLEIHKLDIHYSDNTGFCNFCNRNCGGVTKLRDHLNIHSHQKLLTCNFCNTHFYCKKQFIRHKKQHNNEPHTCNICNTTFFHLRSLNAHISDLHI